ncbi:cupin domain-containing protein [Streptoverticillium reticulum]|uniref:cupin domain-containing protein n=1 Tax=Streptoverticillium reticulum TaxID=1433415 RepID=UPI0039BF4CA1
MHNWRSGRICGIAAGAIAIGLTGSSLASADGRVTGAQPKAEVVVEEHAAGRQDDPVKVEVDGPAQVNFRKITIPPGSGTGWHCHYGNLVAVVKQGELTHEMQSGGTHTYKAGDSVIEGSGYVHQGVNNGTEDVVLWVTYVTPEGKPLAETDLTKCDKSAKGQGGN